MEGDKTMYVMETKTVNNNLVVDNIVYDRIVHTFKYKGQPVYLTQNHGFKKPNQIVENFNSSLIAKAIEYNRQRQYRSVNLAIMYNKFKRYEDERHQQAIA